MPATTRPYMKARYWTWRDHARNATPGIGLFSGNQIQAHLTPTEARSLADKLHDMADQIDARQDTKCSPANQPTTTST